MTNINHWQCQKSIIEHLKKSSWSSIIECVLSFLLFQKLQSFILFIFYFWFSNSTLSFLIIDFWRLLLPAACEGVLLSGATASGLLCCSVIQKPTAAHGPRLMWTFKATSRPLECISATFCISVKFCIFATRKANRRVRRSTNKCYYIYTHISRYCFSVTSCACVTHTMVVWFLRADCIAPQGVCDWFLMI